MPVRSETRELLHFQAVREIARQRLTFPTEEHPHYKTYLNVPQRSMGVRANSRAVYPDIAVVQDPENFLKMLGQVETAETVNEEQAPEWAVYAALGPLYLYVPVGYAERAKKLCQKFKAEIVGIRSWRQVVGYEELEISDYFTQWGGPEDLAPGPLGDVLKRLL